MRAEFIPLLLAVFGKHVIASLEMQDQASLPSMCIQGCCGLPNGVKLSLPGTGLECCPCEHEGTARSYQSKDSGHQNVQDKLTSLGYEKDQSPLLSSGQKQRFENSFCPGPWCESGSSSLVANEGSLSDHSNVRTEDQANGDPETPTLLSDITELAMTGFCPPSRPPWCEALVSMFNSTATKSSSNGHTSPQAEAKVESQAPRESPQETKSINNDQALQFFCGTPVPPWCAAVFSSIVNSPYGISKSARNLVPKQIKEQQQSSRLPVDKKEGSINSFCDVANPPPWCEPVLAMLKSNNFSPSSSPQSLKQSHSREPDTNEETTQESASVKEGSTPASWYTLPLAIQISPDNGTSQICGDWGCKPSDEVMKHLGTTLALITGTKKL